MRNNLEISSRNPFFYLERISTVSFTRQAMQISCDLLLQQKIAGIHAHTVTTTYTGRAEGKNKVVEAKISASLRFNSQVASDPEQRPPGERRRLVGSGAEAVPAARGLDVPIHDAAARALVPSRHVVLGLRHGAHHVRPALRRRRPNVARRALERRGEPERRRAARGRCAGGHVLPPRPAAHPYLGDGEALPLVHRRFRQLLLGRRIESAEAFPLGVAVALRHGNTVPRHARASRGALFLRQLHGDAEQGALVHDVLVGPHGETPPHVMASMAGAAAGSFGGLASELAELHRNDHLVLLLRCLCSGDMFPILPCLLLLHAKAEARGGRRVVAIGDRALGAGLEDEHQRAAGAAAGGEVGEEAAAAERAGGVRQQPRVDAVDVERVAALGEEAEAVVVRELAEADRAVERILPAGADHGAVEEHRQRVDEGLVDAGVVEVEQLLELPLEGGSVRVAPVRVAGIPRRRAEQEPDEKVQQAGDEEDDGQDQDDEKDAGADPALESRVRGRRRRWRRRQQRR